MNHLTQIFMYCWAGAGLINWLAMNGYNNRNFRKTQKFSEPLVWILIASVCSGFGGLIVSLIVLRNFKDFAFMPLSKKEQGEILMLKKLENGSTKDRLEDGFQDGMHRGC